jgi:hypothetical protein
MLTCNHINALVLLEMEARNRESSSRSMSGGEPCDRQRICPTRQLTRDAERVNSRRRAFLRIFLRLFASFGRQSRPLLRPRESGQAWPQKPPLSPCPSRLFAPNSPPLCLGVETTSLPTPSQRMHPLSKEKPDTVGQVLFDASPLSSQQDSSRRSDTTTRNTKDYVTATAGNQNASLLRRAPWNIRQRGTSRCSSSRDRLL